MTPTPLISVIMPVYNTEKYVGDAIESIVNQEFTDFEFFIIDDCSTDDSLHIIRSYSDPRIRLIANSTNLGNYASRNIAMRLARGKYTCVMDSDDIAMPNRLLTQFNFMEYNDEYVGLGSYAYILNTDGSTYPSIRAFGEDVCKVNLLQNNVCYHPSMIMRNDVLLKNNIFYNERYYYAADFDLMVQLSKVGAINNIPSYLLYYRVHSGQISRSKYKEQQMYADQIRLSQLAQFEFVPTTRECDFHLKLMSNSLLTADEIIIAEKWIDILIGQNNKNPIYNHQILTDFLTGILKNKKKMSTHNEQITVILTVWKRKHLLEQLEALLSQTLQPAVIWVQQTLYFVDACDTIAKYRDKIKYTLYKENKGVFGRFESVTEITTDYVLIIDDDIIPGTGFLENALTTSKKYNSIVSPHGRIISCDNNLPSQYIGDGYHLSHSFCEKDTEVDFGNNSWFFKTEWIYYFLKTSALYRNNGEDIHLSASCKLGGGIRTFIPQQLTTFEAGNLRRSYSMDEHALHSKQGFNQERSKIVAMFRNSGWKLLQENTSISEPTNPLISVVMVVYNEDMLTCHAISSILNQNFANFEFMILGNNFTTITERFQDKRIRYVRLRQPLNYFSILNIGIKLSKGKYICVMDEKCASTPNRLAVQFNFMENNPNLQVAGCLYRISEKNKIFGKALNYDEVKKIFERKNVFLHSTLILKSQTVKSINYYNEKYLYAADYDLLCRMATKGEAVIIGDCLLECPVDFQKIKSRKHRDEERNIRNLHALGVYKLKDTTIIR